MKIQSRLLAMPRLNVPSSLASSSELVISPVTTTTTPPSSTEATLTTSSTKLMPAETSIGTGLPLPSRLSPQPISKSEYNFNQGDFINIPHNFGDSNTSTHAVKKVLHRTTQKLMLCKLLPTVPKAFKEIQREIDIHIRCNNSPYIVHFYGTCERPNMIQLYTEFMDAGSFHEVYRRTGRVPQNILAITAFSVVKGLLYLKTECGVIHRDIKPSNILVSSKGDIKICDFSVSNVLINSLAKSYVGCLPYMSPERLNSSVVDAGGESAASSRGTGYTVLSDVWSLGISLIELALAKCPIPPLSEQEIDELMMPTPTTGFEVISRANLLPPVQLTHIWLFQYYRDYPSPTVPVRYFTQNFKDFVDNCLRKNPESRPTLSSLLQHDFVSTLHEQEHAQLQQQLASWVGSSMTASQTLRKQQHVTVVQQQQRTQKISMAASSSGAPTAVYGVRNELLELEQLPSMPSEEASWLRRIIGCCK